MTLTYLKARRLSLKGHPEFNEAWLQEVIASDPTILGLGEVSVIDREGRQVRAGRLDLLLSDSENSRRYEVELMLGPTDESHIIRTIEYWDIERRRFPQYDHVAVIVAEDIASRFLNILGLFNGTIPMIAIQLSALQVGEQVVLDFVRVMDVFALRNDDLNEPPPPPADPAYWNNRATPQTVRIAERCVELLNQAAGRERFFANYNRQYIGLRDGNKSSNFVKFKPRKQFTHVELASVPSPEAWIPRLHDEGLEAGVQRDGGLLLSLRPGQLEEHEDQVSELFLEALANYGS